MYFKYSEFIDLPLQHCPVEFRAIPVSLHRKDFIAKSPEGAPVFLLCNPNSKKYIPSINFRNISIEFNVECRLSFGNDDFNGNFCIVKFTENFPELYEMFVRCVCSTVDKLPTNASTKTIESFILELGELFRTLNSPGGREISGLWAELFIISIASDSVNALKSWHNDPYDLHDFSNERMLLEVKSTVRNIRVHDFSLEQLTPNVNGGGFIVSVLLNKIASGTGVIELAKLIEDKVREFPELRKKLWRIILESLGEDFSEKIDKKFDVEFAKKNVKIYPMDVIPRPLTSDDKRVTNIRFSSNLDDLHCVSSNNPMCFLNEIFGCD